MRKLPISEINRINAKDFSLAEKCPLVIVLDNIRSLHNIGSIFRTCDAFACKSIILCGITGTPPHREIQKTALGATETVKWEYYESPIKAVLDLKSEGYRIVSLEIAEGSTALEEFQIKKEDKIAIVLGNEVDGVMQEIIDLSESCIEIPQYGTKHSLNVAVSGGIAIWEISEKMRKALEH